MEECNGEVEELFLRSARNGDYKMVTEILQAREDGKVVLDINCKGKSKCNLGWMPLHLACYFGHKETADILLQNGANVDVQNDSGDTPLHKAALTNREEIVMLLLEHGANVSIINGEGLRASDMARKNQVRKLILGAEKTEKKIREEKFIHAAREGDLDTVKKIFHDPCAPNINCTDSMGNTGLHCAAYRGHINVAVVLLQNGCDTSIKNVAGQTALELVQSQQMEQVLAVPPVRSFCRSASRFEGPLLRRMRIVGWRMVWSVLERGVLTFFSSRADASSGVGRRDYKYLDSAKVVPAIGGDQAVFVVQYSDGTRHRLAALPDPVHSACVNRQKWVSALEDHIKFSTHYVHHGFSIETDDEEEDEKDIKPLGCMEDALATAKAHQELLEQQVEEVMALISYLEEEQLKQGSVHAVLKKFNSLSSNARNMASSLSHCLSLVKQQEEVRELQLKEEKEKVRVLEEALRVLATEQHDLEESIASRLSSSSDGVSLYNTPANSFRSNPKPRRFFPTGVDDEFFDAFSQDDDTCTLKSLPSPCESECSTNTLVSCMSSLPLDPQSPEGRLPARSSSSSFSSGLHLTSPGEDTPLCDTFTRVTPEETNDKACVPLGENESIVTISSGTYQGHHSRSGSSSLTISLTDSNRGLHGGDPSPISLTPSSTQGLTPEASHNMISSSTKESDMGRLTASNGSINLPRGTSTTLINPHATPGGTNSSGETIISPETPLVRTSDLSEADEDASGGDSDNTLSSQSGEEHHNGTSGPAKEENKVTEQSRDGDRIEEKSSDTSSFSLIYLGGTRYKGARGGPKRLWRNWGRNTLNPKALRGDDVA